MGQGLGGLGWVWWKRSQQWGSKFYFKINLSPYPLSTAAAAGISGTETETGTAPQSQVFQYPDIGYNIDFASDIAILIQVKTESSTLGQTSQRSQGR